MATIAIFGATGYAGRAITDEALRRGHVVVAVSRHPESEPDRPGLRPLQGSVFEDDLVERLADEADVLVVAIPAREIDGRKLVDALPSLSQSAAGHHTRLGIVGGAGSLRVAEGGPRLVDTPSFPDAFKGEAVSHADVLTALEGSPALLDWFYLSPAAEFGAYNPGVATGTYRLGGDLLLTGADGRSQISGADFARAFVDEIEEPRHHRARFCVAY